ncbi:MAG: 30S ribosomal protein S2 [Candidatus Altiarchaeota archaeon]|nr:30S ribosomal protein S2 [Candidatus Altiarchaeota archaeon]
MNARQILVKNGAHIGTPSKVEAMKRFIFKIRPDGLAIINVQSVDERLRTAAKMLAQYEPEDILIVANREQAHKPVEQFCKHTGFQGITGRFFPGTMTNPNLDYFIEPKLLMVIDPWVDKQSVTEATKQRIPVISLVSTNNTFSDIDLVVPCNNKGRKSLAAIFYVLTHYVLYEKKGLTEGQELEAKFETFFDDSRDSQ